jgi:hypothetical protein
LKGELESAEGEYKARLFPIGLWDLRRGLEAVVDVVSIFGFVSINIAAALGKLVYIMEG